MLDKQYKEMEEKILKDAESVEIPESLKPENVRTRLLFEQKKKRMRTITKVVASAAVFVITATVIAVPFLSKNNAMNGSLQYETAELGEPRQNLETYYLPESKNEVVEFLEESSSVNIKNFGAAIDGNIDLTVDEEISVEDEVYKNQEENEATHGTNVITAGIDEGDLVKTDGEKLYLASGNEIRIIDLLGGKLDELSTINVDKEENLCEMFAHDGKLILFVETKDKEDSIFIRNFFNNKKKNIETKVHIYDVSNASEPSLIKTMEQSGNYKSARMVDGYVYTFSEEHAISGIYPCVNKHEVDIANIYLSEDAENGTVLTVFSLDNPTELSDELVVYSSGTEVYMGPECMYLYARRYIEGNEGTEIVKINYKNGKYDLCKEAIVEGHIQGPFGIYEKDGNLCVLTTAYDMEGESKNLLLILDSNLELMSKVDDIAPGEVLYGSRFVGDMVYFVTFYTTDPLFAVDLSDMKNPRVLGELKITGFSDYLHAVDENHLLGIGYEAKEETGSITSCKMTLFDAKDPTNLKVLDTYLLSDEVWIPALEYENGYKQYWVNDDLQMVGFLVGNLDGLFEYQYKVFTWKNGTFEEVLSESVGSVIDEDVMARGIFAGDLLYVVSNQKITGFDILGTKTKVVEKIIDK